ncbi:hypothetical protein ACSYAD_31825 [Acaryochloris marina NIES-2412]|uniref:hypothetical protein n=1 Tax=Acaryochloris marina TaxID=155978 RepID=UPI00405A0008
MKEFAKSAAASHHPQTLATRSDPATPRSSPQSAQWFPLASARSSAKYRMSGDN